MQLQKPLLIASVGTLAVLGSITPLVAAPSARLTVNMSAPGKTISPLLYGIFFEEINRAGDGGIYAEMVQNRSFEDTDFPLAWTLIKSQNAAANVELDKSKPLNSQNPTSLRVTVSDVSGGRVGVVNRGFAGTLLRGNKSEWQPKFENASGGLAVQKGKTYDLSFYARATASNPLVASLESSKGVVLASQKVTGVGNGWKKFSVSLSSKDSDSNARLVISTDKTGTFWLDMVSLFPRDTWKNRPNGLRADLMEKIDAMKPAFVRFPGGCFVEGDRLENRFVWKETIGDVATRPGHWNLWSYRSTDGLGYLEYLQMCEDLKAEPLFVINVGMSHQGVVPMAQMGPYVQDALDAIEYANGPVTSKWGALRAKHGHPKPFTLKLMQIGNENGGAAYNERYALFHDAIKAKYPNINLVACDWGGTPKNRPLDIIDPHLYSNPQTMINQSNRFDNSDRSGPHIYFGEYAVTEQSGTGNLQAAVAEAAFMTGLERNGDIVKMSSYAPLLSHWDWKAWNPNAIVYDQSQLYGTPSYYVQQMFGANRGDVNLPVAIEQPKTNARVASGKIGVGTWDTQAEFKDIKVTKNGQTLFASDFSQNTNGWKTTDGQWSVMDGSLRQGGGGQGVRASIGDVSWSDYTLSLKARKLGGAEGFLITFTSPDDQTKTWWNLGGWGNKEHGLELEGSTMARVPGTIETNRWYDIRIELKGDNIKAYLDGKLIHDVNRSRPALYAVAGRDKATGEAILKVVNTSGQPVETAIDLNGAKNVAATGNAWTLAGPNPLAENSFMAPTRLATQKSTFTAGRAAFNRTLPANSVTVIRLKAGS
ncbi:DUF1080 domain-containing protein [bacterium]|nr:MAG: DUF1080 domain-containing protein [bacterium]